MKNFNNFLDYMTAESNPDPSVVREHLNYGEEADDVFLSALDQAINGADRAGERKLARLLREAYRIGEDEYDAHLKNS